MAAELISFGVGFDWIKKLWGMLEKRLEKYKKELEEINNTVLCDPLDIAQYYIEPECQDSNPADHSKEDYPVTKSPIMKRIDDFFQYVPVQQGENQMIILSDAGMGKTALLTMIKLLHLTAFWPEDKDCVLKKLGKTTLNEVAKIENKRDTILLLDSLDEDTEAFGKVQGRLISILKATQQFHKTIITCRTQFFKAESDPFNRPGIVMISGFVCMAKYLSFFSVQKVEEYLIKRFPPKYLFFTDKQKIAEAQKVIAKMGLLRCRPMLLSHIEDLMAMRQIKGKDSEYHVYDALVKSWLNRQETKPDTKVSAKELLPACIILAAVMQIREKRSISEQDLDALIEKIKDVFPVTKIDIKGKSLINRNSDGDYCFSHFSIQEFLVAKMLLEKPEGKFWFTPKQNHKIRMTDFIVRMMLVLGKVPNFVELLDFKGMNLVNADLKGIQLPGADLSGIDLSGADLRNANLRGANLSNAKFDGAKLESSQYEPVFSFREKLGMIFVYIPPGEFMMGSPENEPGRYDNETLHKVNLSKGFYMQTTTVTVAHWKAFVSETGYKSEAETGGGAYAWTGTEWKKDKDKNWKNPGFEQTEQCPVTCVSWNDAQEFVKWLNLKEGSDKYRLPTEAEWEYACRAGTTTPFHFGKCLSTDQANYDGNYPLEGCPKGIFRKKTVPVGSFAPNAWGLYDMHGNVWEWCQDNCNWDSDKKVVVTDTYIDGISDPLSEKGSSRVLRGGGWLSDARYCRSAYRAYHSPGYRADCVGFRLCFSPKVRSPA